VRRVGALVVSLLVLATCCTARSTDNAIRIGALYPLKGAQGPGGLDEYRGVTLAVARVNAGGGVHGRPVRLDTVDVESAEAAPAAVRKLSGDGVRLLLGSYGSTISAPASEVAAAQHMLFWETGAVGVTAAASGGGRTFFRAAPTGATLGRSAVSFIRDELSSHLQAGRPLRYAVAYVDDAYGRSVGMGGVDELQSSHQDLVGSFPYPAYGTDYNALAAKIGAAKPDVLFVSAYLEDGIALRQAMLAQHVPLLAGIGTSSSYCMPAFGARLGQAAVGLFASDKPDAADVRTDALQPEARTELAWAGATYLRRFHQPMSAAALAGFANAWALLHDVLPVAHDTGVTAVAAAALGVKLPTGSLANGSGLDFAGPTQLDAGANRRAASVIWEWVAPNQRAVVWPPAFATHPLVSLPVA
jgi:branched-chain amino acid transport system substrate-binding protein